MTNGLPTSANLRLIVSNWIAFACHSRRRTLFVCVRQNVLNKCDWTELKRAQLFVIYGKRTYSYDEIKTTRSNEKSEAEYRETHTTRERDYGELRGLT